MFILFFVIGMKLRLGVRKNNNFPDTLKRHLDAEPLSSREFWTLGRKMAKVQNRWNSIWDLTTATSN